jgi:hypothetical protein
MQHNGFLILKYHGEKYSTHETTIPINLVFDDNGDLQMCFFFEFPGSPTKESVVFNSKGNLNEKSILQPYGIDLIIPNSNEFYVHFMMVEELVHDDSEVYSVVAKFNTEFIGDKTKFLVYNF